MTSPLHGTSPSTFTQSSGIEMDSLSVEGGRRQRSQNSSDDEPLLGDTDSRPPSRRQRKRGWCLVPTSPKARRSFGMLLLGVVVFLWVSSNFLTYAIFSDDTYSKPYFVTYISTATFCLYLVPSGVRSLLGRQYFKQRRGSDASAEPILADIEDAGESKSIVEEKLDTRQTMRLSAEFCLLWFIANYFSSYSFKFTSVASATILSSTSSMFTLLLGALLHVERFTYPKLVSVLISLLGISFISSTDLDPEPSSTIRTPVQILLGDLMALISALSYGTYITLLKVRIGDESRVDMQRFFGFVGLFNVIFLWPGLFILHYLDIEQFELPPQGRVWGIVAIMCSITLVSDYCWAYAMLLTTPLIVTVGLSLTIPLALLGQMALLEMVAGPLYWIGAGCVFAAFWVLNRQERVEEAAIDPEESEGNVAT